MEKSSTLIQLLMHLITIVLSQGKSRNNFIVSVPTPIFHTLKSDMLNFCMHRYNPQAPANLLASNPGWAFFSELRYSIIAHVGTGHLLNDHQDLTTDVSMLYAGKVYNPLTQSDPNWKQGYTVLAKKMDTSSNLLYGWTTMAFAC